MITRHKSYKPTQQKISAQLKEISKNLESYIALTEAGAKEALDEIAQEIHDRSIAICPVDTGELKESAYIFKSQTKDSYSVEIGYEDPKSIFVHENGNRNHDYRNPTTPNTHWQFLLGPASEVENEIAQRVADNIKGKL